MASGSRLGTVEWMRLVTLAALNLALFQGVWWLLIFPPITLLVVAINLTLYGAWVRRGRHGMRLPAAAFAGLLASLGMGLYTAYNLANPILADRLLAVLPDAARRVLPHAPLGLPLRRLVEYALLDLLGLAAMILGGRLAPRRRSGRQDRAGGNAAPGGRPLDDGRSTPCNPFFPPEHDHAPEAVEALPDRDLPDGARPLPSRAGAGPEALREPL